MPVVVYGPAYSTYARTVRLALEEKGVDYRLEEVDILKGAATSPEHLARHPFGKVPAFEHDGFLLFETAATTRYIDEAFPGPALQPSEVRQRARMMQVIGVIDAYAYGAMITNIFIQRAVMPMLGGTADEAAIKGALPRAETSVRTLDRLIGECGEGPTLADLHLVPVYDYFRQTPEGAKLLEGCGNLARWWERMSKRPSVEKTRPRLG